MSQRIEPTDDIAVATASLSNITAERAAELYNALNREQRARLRQSAKLQQAIELVALQRRHAADSQRIVELTEALRG